VFLHELFHFQCLFQHQRKSFVTFFSPRRVITDTAALLFIFIFLLWQFYCMCSVLSHSGSLAFGLNRPVDWLTEANVLEKRSVSISRPEEAHSRLLRNGGLYQPIDMAI
jgi:hypothetical protein